MLLDLLDHVKVNNAACLGETHVEKHAAPRRWSSMLFWTVPVNLLTITGGHLISRSPQIPDCFGVGFKRFRIESFNLDRKRVGVMVMPVQYHICIMDIHSLPIDVDHAFCHGCIG